MFRSPGSQSATRDAGFHLKLIVAFVAIYLIWGSTYLGIKVTIEAMPPFMMAGARFFLAGVLMLAWLAMKGRFAVRRLTPRGVGTAAIVGVLMLAGGNGVVVWAIAHGAPTGLCAVMIATTPFWLVLLDRLAGASAPVRPRVIAGLALGFVGIVVLSGIGGDDRAGLELSAMLVLLVATLCWATGSIISKHGRHHGEPLVSTGLQMLIGGAAILVYSAATESWATVDPAQFTARSWIGFAYLVLFGSLVGYTAFIWLLRHVSAAAVGTYAYVNPVVAMILGLLVLGEPISLRTATASALILGAVVLITTARSRRSPSTTPSRRVEVGAGPAACRR